MRLSIFSLLTLVSVGAAAVLDSLALPTPVDGATARSYLATLTVAAESTTPAYDRSMFKHWITISGSCDTRETVLKRDGTNVVVATDCSPTSGQWVSPYDGVTVTASRSLDIDHVVPLKEAWISGASSWTNSTREAFANDLTRPQLVAVTNTANRSKGAKDPAKWMPPLASYHCTYARAWVQVKHDYGLSVDTAEKAALTTYLAPC